MSNAPDITNATLCEAAQLWLVDYLKTRATLTGVKIIGRREKTIAGDIEAAISALGACIYVLPLLPLKLNPNLPGPHIELAELRVRCIEDDTLNATLPNVFALVEHVVREVSGLTCKAVNTLGVLNPAPSPVQQQEDPGRLIYDVIFHTKGQYEPRIEMQ